RTAGASSPPTNRRTRCPRAPVALPGARERTGHRGHVAACGRAIAGGGAGPWWAVRRTSDPARSSSRLSPSRVQPALQNLRSGHLIDHLTLTPPPYASLGQPTGRHDG